MGLFALPRECKQAKDLRSACTLLQMSLTFPAHSYGLSLSFSFCVSPSLPPPLLPPFLLSLSAPGLRSGRGMWMDARMDGLDPTLAFSLFANLRTQLPGETMMTPPPHTQPAHRGPPAGDTLHRAATTAANKVSQHRKRACILIYTCKHLCIQAITHKHP